MRGRWRGLTLVPLGVWALAGAACGAQNSPAGGAVSKCSYLLVGASPVAGDGGGTCPRLGAELFTLRLSDSALPILAKDPAGHDLPPYPAPTDKGTIVLNASPKGAGVAVPGSAPQQAIGDVVAIADFTPLSDGDSRFGINLRCTFTACISAAIKPPGTYEIRDSGADRMPARPVATGSAHVRAGTSRLVVAAHASVIDVWLNGDHLGTFTTMVSDPGVVAFVDVADGVDQARVKVSSFQGFGAM